MFQRLVDWYPLKLELPGKANFFCRKILGEIAMPAVEPNTKSLDAVDRHVGRSFDLDEEHGSYIVDDGSKVGQSNKGMAIIYCYGPFDRRIAKPEIAIVVRLFGNFW